MLRHVVLFRFVDTMTDEQRQAAVTALRQLPDLVPTIRGYRVGLDAGHGDGNWDLAVVGDFDDVDGWRVYSEHPEHLRVRDGHVAPFLVERAAVQYEI